MRIAVMGAGAVGCYYGALLARAGHAVTLIGRPSHVDAMLDRGLRLQTRELDVHLRVHASTDAAAAADAQLLLLCVKSTDTEAAAAALARHLPPQTPVLSLQNGVDNVDRLRRMLPNPVSAAVVYVATEMAGPGHVLHHGRGELVLAPGEGTRAAEDALRSAGVPVSRSDDVVSALWAKLVLNCAWNALSAITQLPYGRLVQGEAVQAVMEDIVAECLAVAARDGVRLPGDLRQAVRGIAQSMPAQRSSTAQDLRRGRPTEIAHINGHVVARGDALGVPTPVNRTLLALVRLLEAEAAHAAAPAAP
jgi:2-dehydropantoate 2-reductase